MKEMSKIRKGKNTMSATTIKKDNTVRIAHFGTFDLESLGDTMFPVIFRMEMEERFGDRVEIDLYSPNGTEHPYNCLTQVYPIDTLPQRHAKKPYCALVIGGGEFIHFQTVQYQSPEGEAMQYHSGELWKKPQEIAAGIDLPVMWNCVGVGRDFEKEGQSEQVRQACEGLHYLSVRDPYSYIRLQKMAGAGSIHQAPDMLWLFNKHISKEILDTCFVGLKKEYRFLGQKYLVLQYGTSMEYEKMALQIQEISRDYGLAVLLLAVNYCHEDQEVSCKMQEVCQDFYMLGRKLQPREIMAVIAHAEFFLGTSLHGNITAMSYSVKNLCLDMYPSCVGKLDGLFAMLQMEELLVRDTDSLRIQFDAQMCMENRNTVAEKAAQFQKELECHFDRIAGLLQDSANQQMSGKKIAAPKVLNKETAKGVRPQYRLIKSILNNGSVSTGCNSMMEISGPGEGRLELEYQVQSTGVPCQGRFYCPHPFIVEKIEAVEMEAVEAEAVKIKTPEKGKTAKCSLQDTVDNAKGLALYKDCCRFSVWPEAQNNENVILKLYITLRDAWQEYAAALEGQVQAGAQNLKNKQGHIELLLESERKLSAETREQQNQMNRYAKEGQDLRRELAQKLECLEKSAQEKERLKQELETEQKRRRAYAQAEQTYKQELKDKQGHITQLLESEQQLEQELKNKQGHIELLLESEREFERVKKSRTWRFAFRMQQMSALIVPPGSARRLFLKMLVKFIRHPVQFLKKLTPGRIRNFYRFFREEGAGFVSERIDMSMPEAGYQDTKPLVSMDMIEKDFSEYEPLSFPLNENPDVSVIIPVYNQFSYTYQCLKSILEHTGSTVLYEIIVADDCSLDDTKRLGELAKNIRIIRNEKNLLFLKNCNHAAAYARGKYLLFLNNDTQVQENWLEPLVHLMERNEKVGMTGSKLIYPDGKLQEAGGILWKDGSAWNYGNGQEADRPEFNYVKEVDYISGASLMIRKTLWEEIGGFDERYVPAYCEDSDLAFEVRKHGYRVVYQPQSVVVHFEGISNGKEKDKGKALEKERNIKHFQVENSQKLAQKWADVLKCHEPNAHNVFRARERSKGKPMLLMIDHYVPQYDQDAGSKTVYQYLQMFVKKGFQVKFIGDNFYRHEPYTGVLEQLGIEVLYGSFYQSHIFQWLDANHKYFDFVFLNRPHISIKYIDYFYSKTDIKIIYYGHDLHFLRSRRAYELTGNAALQKEAKEWMKQELYLMERAAVSYYPSCVEVQEIHNINAALPVKAVTAYVYDTAEQNVLADFSKRDGMLFVGGFVHQPNLDAVRWFVREILPFIRKHLDAAFYIVGSHVPKELTELDGKDGICVKGFVSEEELQKLYGACRLAVVPLRYGAGVKGKVIEAAHYGVPVVTTSVGAEGIADAGDILYIQDEPQAFAEELVRLYKDPESLQKTAGRMREFMKQHFSEEAVWKCIEADFAKAQ